MVTVTTTMMTGMEKKMMSTRAQVLGWRKTKFSHEEEPYYVLQSHLFIHSLRRYLLCISYCFRYLGHNSEQDKMLTSPCKATVLPSSRWYHSLCVIHEW